MVYEIGMGIMHKPYSEDDEKYAPNIIYEYVFIEKKMCYLMLYIISF